VRLAVRDEIADLEAAGNGTIQVDEPALRELLSLRQVGRKAYLDWTVAAFRLATSGRQDLPRPALRKRPRRPRPGRPAQA
jgi:5-methyltetrahydropteroyltriglutamate--homocysteine methyltransferase